MHFSHKIVGERLEPNGELAADLVNVANVSDVRGELYVHARRPARGVRGELRSFTANAFTVQRSRSSRRSRRMVHHVNVKDPLDINVKGYDP